MLFSSLVLSACYYDNFEERGIRPPNRDCPTPESSYSMHIRPWIEARCIDCHNANFASGQLDLSTYQDVFDNAASIQDRINRQESDPKKMPTDGPKLNRCQLDGFDEWIDLGKPQN